MSLKSPLRTLNSSLRISPTSLALRNSVRYASLTGAINHGIRKSQDVGQSPNLSNNSRGRSREQSVTSFNRSRGHSREQAGDSFKNSRVRPREQGATSFNNSRGRPREQTSTSFNSSRGRSREQFAKSANDSHDRPGTKEQPFISRHAPRVQFDEEEFIRTGSFMALPREHQRSTRAPQVSRGRSSQDYVPTPEDERKRQLRRVEHHKATEARPERVKEHVLAPKEIPYTTPASEFLYGTTAVEAALRCKKRKVYKLYIYQGANEEELRADKLVLRKLALSMNVVVKLVFAEWERVLDKMSSGRPHNGVILEVSPLPRIPIKALRPVQLQDDEFRVELAPQTAEEAEVNGTHDCIPINSLYTQQHRRYPVIVLCNGIVDQGNLGAIIRSAYYLGVDAIVFAGRNSAPLSSITIKASAGAAENMTLLNVDNEVDFIKQSQANKWRFYAADALESGATYLEPGSIQPPSPRAVTGEEHPADVLGNSPSVIMMGNEGAGLSRHVKAHADAVVTIPGARFIAGLGTNTDPARVDSLNVSVAATLLMQMFLRIPLGVSTVPKRTKGLAGQ
ncbi:Alpha/beta knot methyltransferase [Aspergillus multicolor]|uniref:TrmH family RNA methyltransferase n=1 Tax=Aspergillus multicolor TaxID=41759 RepID=UPI003CCDE7A4